MTIIDNNHLNKIHSQCGKYNLFKKGTVYFYQLKDKWYFSTILFHSVMSILTKAKKIKVTDNSSFSEL